MTTMNDDDRPVKPAAPAAGPDDDAADPCDISFPARVGPPPARSFPLDPAAVETQEWAYARCRPATFFPRISDFDHDPY